MTRLTKIQLHICDFSDWLSQYPGRHFDNGRLHISMAAYIVSAIRPEFLRPGLDTPWEAAGIHLPQSYSIQPAWGGASLTILHRIAFRRLPK